MSQSNQENTNEQYEANTGGDTGNWDRKITKQNGIGKVFLEKNHFSSKKIFFNGGQNFLTASMFVSKGTIAKYLPSLGFKMKLGNKDFTLAANDAQELLDVVMQIAMFIQENKLSANEGMEKSREEFHLKLNQSMGRGNSQ